MLAKQIINIFTVFILSILITACNSTPKQVKLIKKPIVSDHYLLMSLIDRPITEDQKMMISFTQQRKMQYGAAFVNEVNIKGPKLNESIESKNIYKTLVDNDINSIAIYGTKNQMNKI